MTWNSTLPTRTIPSSKTQLRNIDSHKSSRNVWTNEKSVAVTSQGPCFSVSPVAGNESKAQSETSLRYPARENLNTDRSDDKRLEEIRLAPSLIALVEAPRQPPLKDDSRQARGSRPALRPAPSPASLPIPPNISIHLSCHIRRPKVRFRQRARESRANPHRRNAKCPCAPSPIKTCSCRARALYTPPLSAELSLSLLWRSLQNTLGDSQNEDAPDESGEDWISREQAERESQTLRDVWLARRNIIAGNLGFSPFEAERLTEFTSVVYRTVNCSL